MWKLKSEIMDYLPHWFREIVELQALCAAEKERFEALALAVNAVADNFFFQTMDEGAVRQWERIFDIYPDYQNESLDFRRKRLINRISTKPPFTLAFLHQKLDELIGAGAYTVEVDYPNYTLYIEASVDSWQWTSEVAYTIGKIKPAHIVYVSRPLVINRIAVNESVELSKQIWNYKLGSWGLGLLPFATHQSQGVIVMPDQKTIEQGLLEDTAADIASRIVAKARINGSILITNLNKSASGNAAVIQYSVDSAQTGTITQIELLNQEDTVLTKSPVYIPVTDTVTLKHSIPVEEA